VDWAGIASGQGGIISRRQLRQLSHSDRSIDGLLHRGRLLTTTCAGVYRVAGAPESPEGRRWLAVLATRSPLSYLTAAQLWNLPVADDGRLHITRFDRKRLVWPAGVRVHRVVLEPDAVTDELGPPVTNRVETLLDCLGSIPPAAARTLADRAKQQRWLERADLEHRLKRQPGRWGNQQLRSLLAAMGDDAHSEAERRLHALLRGAGIIGWRANLAVTIPGGRFVIDAAFVQQRIAIEIDGYGPHSSREAFQGDRTKSNLLIAAGWTVLRFTWSDLVDRPSYVIATIRQLLAS
jgi:very-short-patch-repair endonuclease